MSEGLDPQLTAIMKAMPKGFYGQLLEFVVHLEQSTIRLDDVVVMPCGAFRIEFHRVKRRCPTCGNEELPHD